MSRGWHAGAARRPCAGAAADTMRYVIDLVYLPLMTRSLCGEKLELLRAQIGSHVACGVTFFLAA